MSTDSEVIKETYTREEIEATARQQGWAPEKGSKTAIEYLADGRKYRDNLYDDVKKLQKENEKLYSLTAGFISKQDQKEQATKQATRKEEITKAVEAGDTEKVIQLTEEIKQPEADPNLEYINTWVAEHDWYRSNPEMQADAMGFYQAEVLRLEQIHGKGNGDRPTEILPKVEERIKKVHAEYFAPKNPGGLPSGADKGGKQKQISGSGLQESDLTEVEKRHFEDFVKSGMSREKLLQAVERQRARNG